ncbi:MAG: hypothetical protein ACUVTZ_09345 [Armatimonadota bacterium]
MSKFLCLLGGLVLVAASVWGMARWWNDGFKWFLLSGVILLVFMVGLVLAAWGVGSILESMRESRQKASGQAQSQSTGATPTGA